MLPDFKKAKKAIGDALKKELAVAQEERAKEFLEAVKEEIAMSISNGIDKEKIYKIIIDNSSLAISKKLFNEKYRELKKVMGKSGSIDAVPEKDTQE